MMDKPKVTVVGTVNEISIFEEIENFNPNVPEQILTAKRAIYNKFAERGYSSDMVDFEIKHS